MLLQARFFSVIDLAQIAQELDQAEHQLMAEHGVETPEFIQYAASDSSNVDACGNFSIEVLSAALRNWNLECINLDAKDVADAREDPMKESGFICNLDSHWFALRKLGDKMYSLNSLQDGPCFITPFYVSAFLEQIRMDGYSIFVVRGEYPSCRPPGCSENGYWFAPEDVPMGPRKQNSEAIKRAMMTGSKCSGNNAADDDDDADYKTAIARSMEDENVDEDLKKALEMSMSCGNNERS